MTESLPDVGPAARYRRAWLAGIKFVERLAIDEVDAAFSAEPERLVGGVRATLASSDVRIDYVGHALIALAKGLELLEVAGPPAPAA